MYRVAIVCLALGLAACRAEVRTYDSGTRIGTVQLYPVRARAVAVVFLFSNAQGWNDEVAAAATALQARGAVVIGVDLHGYLQRLAESDDRCHYLLYEIEDLSQRVQHDLALDVYHVPILTGVGQGATLAYAALAQERVATVAGAVGIDQTPNLATRVPLCPGASATADPAGGFRYTTPRRPLLTWWRQGQRGEETLASRLVSLLPEVTTADGDRAHALPLVEYRTPGAELALIFFSGDGGWRDLDKQIGEMLARRGIAVIGVDSLRYFWSSKPPEQIATDLTTMMRTYGQRWNVSRFALAGYSFGADVLPFAYNRLPADLRAQVAQVSLLGLESSAIFEFKLEGWLYEVPGQPILPELTRMPTALVQCFYGEEEKDTLCPAAEKAGMEVIRTKGSHHFDGNYAALAERILAGLERRGVRSTRDHTPQAAADEGGDVGENDRQP